jgi:hypothetical protein
MASCLAAGLLGYVADRLNLPSGGLTRNEAVARLREEGLDEDAVAAIDDLLAEFEAVEYGGAPGDRGEDLTDRTKNCIDRLERARF